MSANTDATMPNAGRLTIKSAPFVAHYEDWDTLLVRVGHHLWRAYRQAFHAQQFAEMDVYLASLDSVWTAKRLYREPILAARRTRMDNAGERLRQRRRRRDD